MAGRRGRTHSHLARFQQRCGLGLGLLIWVASFAPASGADLPKAAEATREQVWLVMQRVAPADEAPHPRLATSAALAALVGPEPERWRIVAIGAVSEAPPAGASDLFVSADEVQYSEGQRHIQARGRVRVSYQNDVLTADQVTVDKDTATVVAEGSARLLHEGQETTAERIEWNYETGVGHAVKGETRYRGVIVRGAQLTAAPGRAQAVNASLTTCDRPRPHYRITARSITVVPGDYVVARGVSAWLLGVRLLTVPRVRYSLRPGGGGGSVFPTIGYNTRDGVYVSKRLRLIDDPAYTVDFDGRLAFKRGFLGGVEALQSQHRLRWIGALKIREPAPNQRVRFLEVDRLPEVGLLWVPQAEVRSRFLPSQVQSVERTPEEQTRWLTLGQVTLGYFRQRRQEFRGDVAVRESDVRLDTRLELSGPALRVGGVRLAKPRVLARGAVYGSGDRFGLLGVGLERTWRLGRDVSVGLERFSHFTTGSSRFVFDEVEIRNEWRPSAEIRSGLNTFSWGMRFDADRRAVFDQEIGFARVLHCLEPRLVYHTRRRQITLEIRIPGLKELE